MTCFEEPCAVKKCLIYPNAQCRNSYCGKCKAVFSVNGREVDCGEFSCRDFISSLSCVSVCLFSGSCDGRNANALASYRSSRRILSWIQIKSEQKTGAVQSDD